MAQNGYWGYYSATPIAAAASGSGSSTGLIITIVVIVVVVAGLIVFGVTRRRTRAADRE